MLCKDGFSLKNIFTQKFDVMRIFLQGDFAVAAGPYRTLCSLNSTTRFPAGLFNSTLLKTT